MKLRRSSSPNLARTNRMKLDREKNGVPKKRHAPPSLWQSTMEYAFVYARKCGLHRYVYCHGGKYIIADDTPHKLPYWEVNPLGEWQKVSESGRLDLPSLRK